MEVTEHEIIVPEIGEHGFIMASENGSIASLIYFDLKLRNKEYAPKLQ